MIVIVIVIVIIIVIVIVITPTVGRLSEVFTPAARSYMNSHLSL